MPVSSSSARRRLNFKMKNFWNPFRASKPAGPKFPQFEAHFQPDGIASGSPPEIAGAPTDPLLAGFFQTYAGTSFNGGLYRVMNAATADFCRASLSLGFANLVGQIRPFGYDWLGRIFALDAKRIVNGQPGVLMFELHADNALDVPDNLLSFHESQIVNDPGPALAPKYFADWLATGGAAPGLNQCIGSKVPFFLGGSDSLQNLELSDLDVYWSITTQLLEGVRGLAPGTRINKISISD